MKETTPHYLLLTATDSNSESPEGRWHFLLHRLDRGEIAMEAADVESHVCGQRLELLAVVRGLEALQQPSRVTLVTEDRYVVRGMRFGLQEWKANGWRWERFGRWVSVKHADLWQRLDRALLFHYVRGRHDRFGGGIVRGPANRTPRRSLQAGSSSSVMSLRPMIPALVRRLQGVIADSDSVWSPPGTLGEPALVVGHSG